MRIVLLVLFLSFFVGDASNAQMAGRMDAAYLATLKAVVNYKIDDEETEKDIEYLRQDRRFNERLQKMLNKLSNSRSKDSKNKEVLKVLENAGKEIYRILN